MLGDDSEKLQQQCSDSATQHKLADGDMRVLWMMPQDALLHCMQEQYAARHAQCQSLLARYNVHQCQRQRLID
jgi:hypothetical protein